MAEWVIGIISVLLCLYEGYCIQSFFGSFAEPKLCRIRNAEWAACITWIVIRIASEGLFSDTDSAALIMELLFTFCTLFVFCVCWYQGEILLKIFLAVQFISLRELSFWTGYSLLYIVNKMIEALVHKAGASMAAAECLPVAAGILSCFGIALVGAAQCALLFVSTRKIAGSYSGKEKGQMGKEVVFYLLPSVAGVLVSVLVRLLLITVIDGIPVLLYEKYPALYFIIPMMALVLLGAIVFSFRIYQNMADLQEERAEKIILENQITQMQGSMVEMEHLYDGVRSVKHDMKNHMAVLQNLIRKRYSGEDEEIRQYFEDMY